MRIKRNGIYREVTPKEFEKNFKSLGYVIVEEVVELTKADIIAKLQSLGIEHNPRARKDELMALL